MAEQFNIRQAEFGDVRELSLVLARAFEEDPFMSWLFPEPKYRFKLAQAWMRVEVENALEMDASWVSMISGEIVAGTIWSPPGRDLHESGTFNQLWYLVLGANPDRTSELAQGLSMIGSGHPEEPHFYLTRREFNHHWLGKAMAVRLFVTHWIWPMPMISLVI